VCCGGESVQLDRDSGGHVCVCVRARVYACVCVRACALSTWAICRAYTSLSLSLSLSLSVRACACVCGVDDSRYYYGPHFMMASIFTIIAGQVFPCAILYLLLHLMLHLIGPFLALCSIS